MRWPRPCGRNTAPTWASNSSSTEPLCSTPTYSAVNRRNDSYQVLCSVRQDDWNPSQRRQSRYPRIELSTRGLADTAPHKGRLQVARRKTHSTHLEQGLDDLSGGDAMALGPGGAGNHHLQHSALGVQHTLVHGALVLAEAPGDRELYVSQQGGSQGSVRLTKQATGRCKSIGQSPAKRKPKQLALCRTNNAR
jgi:hypothetical protein